jgi:hypothetical protein
MQYWCDWDNSCIVFGQIIKEYEKYPKFVMFEDLSGNNYPMIPKLEIFDSIEDAVNELLKHYV